MELHDYTITSFRESHNKSWQLFNDLDHNNRIFFTDFVLYIGYSVEGNYFIFVNGDYILPRVSYSTRNIQCPIHKVNRYVHP